MKNNKKNAKKVGKHKVAFSFLNLLYYLVMQRASNFRDTEKICDKKLSVEHTQNVLNIGAYEIVYTRGVYTRKKDSV